MKNSVPPWLILSIFCFALIGFVSCNSPHSSASDGDSTSFTPSSNGDRSQIAYTSYGNSKSRSGEEVYWSTLNGHPVVLNFWAGSCPPCKAEMPDFETLHNEIGDQVRIIGIDVGQFSGLGSKMEAQRLLGDLGITYETGYSSDPTIMETYRILGMPTTVFINRDGSVGRTWSGIITLDKLRSESKNILKTKAH